MDTSNIKLSAYVTTAEAAEILGLETETVRRYCANNHEGRTPAIEGLKVGTIWLIKKSTLERFSKSRKA